LNAPSEDDVRAALRQVIDPEVGLDVLTMGLIYRITAYGDALHVEMTLTTPGCPMGDYLTGEVQAALEAVEGVRTAGVELTFEPPWHPGMIDREAAEALRRG
jgi:metal-sulfur cluster biosynthetic enzyme